MFPNTDTARVDSTEHGTEQNLTEGENIDNPYYGIDDTSEGTSIVNVTENPYYSGMET